MKKHLLYFLALSALASGCAKEPKNVIEPITTSVVKMGFVPGQFNPTTEGQTVQQMASPTGSVQNYLAYVPKGYNKYPAVKWPLIIYLHDARFKGNDASVIRQAALPAMADVAKNDLQFVLISPQLNYNPAGWVTEDLDKLLAELLAKYNVNPSLVVLTGEGLGGNGTWDWALRKPEQFSVIAPVGGWSDPNKASLLKNLPVWAFRGSSYEGSVENMVNALKAAGGQVNLTVYPDDEKTVGTKIYTNNDVITWATNILTAKGYGNTPFPEGLPFSNMPYGYQVEQFVKQDNASRPMMAGNLFIGSSSIEYWQGLENAFPGKNILKRGIAGSTLKQSLNYFMPYILYPYRPNKIFIYNGENDIAGGATGESVAKDFETYFNNIRKYLPVSTINFMSIKSSPARAGFTAEFTKANDLIKTFLAKQQNAAYIDINSVLLDTNGQPNPANYGPDQLHLNSTGYQLWREILVKYQ